jgi:hypothetical protein
LSILQPTNGQLPLLAEFKGPAAIDAQVLASFGDDEELAIKQAIRWAWLNRRIPSMSQRRGAELLGMSASHFSNLLFRDKYLPPQKLNAFEWMVGNKAVSQTIRRFAEQRERELVDQVAQLVAQQMVRSA